MKKSSKAAPKFQTAREEPAGFDDLVGASDAQPSLILETITPQMAADYLALNINHNRKISEDLVHRYRRDMLSGAWRLTGDCIRFNDAGKLIDGQHRLRACLIAGVPFVSYVIRDLPYDTINVIDSGRSRSASDVLTLRGSKYGFKVAAAAKWLRIFKALNSGEGQGTRTFHLVRPSNDEIVAIVERHPKLEAACLGTESVMGILPSLLVAIRYTGTQLLGKPELADAFAMVFRKGQPYYPENDPALKLREQAMRDKQKGVAMTQSKALATTVHAWNCFASGKPPALIKLPDIIKIKGLDPEKI